MWVRPVVPRYSRFPPCAGPMNGSAQAETGNRKGCKMRFTISGKQIDVGDALSTHVETELGETVVKYSQRPTGATITFSRDAHQFLCDAVVHLSTGLIVQARGAANEVYASFEACREKMDKQLRRYKRRLKDHHKDRTEPVEFGEAGLY